MAELGRVATLTVTRGSAHGAYLDAGGHGEVLLPTRYVPSGTQVGDAVEVFLFRDSEDRMVATTEHPRVMAGEFAALRVVMVNRRVGAFLDWGLPKDLLLPFREQVSPVHEGDTVVVYVLVDPKSDRIIASARLERHVTKSPPPYQAKQKVRLLLTRRTPLGWNALVEGRHLGLLHQSTQVNTALSPGKELEGYVAAVRPGSKIDLSLDPSGYQRVTSLTDQVISVLQAAGGSLPIDDDSTPEAIRETFGMSKKAFKQVLGALYKKRQIEFIHPGIRRVTSIAPQADDWKPGSTQPRAKKESSNNTPRPPPRR